jgi:hypothetical protein
VSASDSSPLGEPPVVALHEARSLLIGAEPVAFEEFDLFEVNISTATPAASSTKPASMYEKLERTRTSRSVAVMYYGVLMSDAETKNAASSTSAPTR